jgi:hypothetical protein
VPGFTLITERERQKDLASMGRNSYLPTKEAVSLSNIIGDGNCRPSVPKTPPPAAHFTTEISP